MGEKASAQNNRLQVDADTATPGIQGSVVVSPGSGNFTVQVWVQNVATTNCNPYYPTQPCGLGGYTLEMHFNPSVISFQSFADGPFLRSTGRPYSFCPYYTSDHHQESGVISVSCTTQGWDHNGPTGSGHLATVTFVPVAIGTTSLQVGESALTDLAGTPLCHPRYTPCDADNGTVIVNYKADLGVTKSAPSSVAAPGTISYTLNVTNGGPAQAGGVSLVDTLPPEVSFSSASAGCTPSGQQVTCDLGTMTNGQNKTVNITASVAANQAGKTALNKADVTTTSVDQTSSNNHAEASTQISPSSVNIGKTAPLSADLNSPGQYRLDVTSTGPSMAGNVIVNDTLPSQVTFTSASTTLGTCSYTAPTVHCNLGDMAPGVSASITINVTFGGAQANVCNAAIALWSPLKTQSTGSKCTLVGYPDTDGDGCLDIIEEGLGFNPNDGYDVYDVPVPAREDAVGDGYGDDLPPIGANGVKNRVVDIRDVLAVLFYALATDDGPPNANGVDYDADKGVDTNGDTTADIPPDGIDDGVSYDRSLSPLPNPPWGAGPPNGVVNMIDVLAVLAQSFTVDCSQPP
jgi:uncharacterized repeat protein (TIGR01451 family)